MKRSKVDVGSLLRKRNGGPELGKTVSRGMDFVVREVADPETGEVPYIEPESDAPLPPGATKHLVDRRDVELQPIAGSRWVHEPSYAVLACNDYLRMGYGRNMRTLLAQYKARQEAGEQVPTTNYNAMTYWSSKYDWASRVDEYDYTMDKSNGNDTIARRAHVIMNTGLAVPVARVAALKRLASYLEGFVYDKDKIWLEDWKAIGFGKYAEAFRTIRFNDPLVNQYRGVLDDLAKETGGRINKIQEVGAKDLDNAIERELARLANGVEGKASGSPKNDPAPG